MCRCLEAEILGEDKRREQEGRLKRQVPLHADILYSGEALVLTLALSVGSSTLKLHCSMFILHGSE